VDLWFDTYEYLKSGGWVMIPLGVCSFLLWFLITERVLEFNSLWSRDVSMLDAIRAIRGERIEVEGDGLRSRLVREFLAGRAGDARLDRHVLRHEAYKLERTLTRSLSAIAVFAAAAPLLGLLGTVLGMIETFDVIAVFGTGNAKAMAGGISVALITTEAGLLVAIPGVLVSSVLRRRSARLRARLRESVAVLDRVIKQGAEFQGGVS
jgi:biopolymer transport protein ExbB